MDDGSSAVEELGRERPSPLSKHRREALYETLKSLVTLPEVLAFHMPSSTAFTALIWWFKEGLIAVSPSTSASRCDGAEAAISRSTRSDPQCQQHATA